MRKIDLRTAEYTEKFAQAEVYAKTAIIQAERISAAGLRNGAYRDRGVRFDLERSRYVIDTYVMREVKRSDGHGCVRGAQLEDTALIEVGQWLAENPKVYETDCRNCYVIDDATFQKRYEPTIRPGYYRAKGMARIIPNDTGDDVEIEAPWGGVQNGDKNCYFCAPYDPQNPEDLAENDRYILSGNDFATYGLLSEIQKEEE